MTTATNPCGICGHDEDEHERSDGICLACMAESTDWFYAHIFEVRTEVPE